jgi:hypothetical protein
MREKGGKEKENGGRKERETERERGRERDRCTLSLPSMAATVVHML